MVGGGGASIEVNAPEPIPIEGSGFRGRLLFLNRPEPEPPHWAYGAHFAGKSRRFELRLQGRFLVEPGEDVFFGVEIPEAVVLSTALRMSANWVMSLVSVLCAARGVAYSYSLDLEEQADGSVLRPHLAFPACAADSIIATLPGEAPPLLTETLKQLPLDERQRVKLNTRDTFTFAYWSKQADFIRWEISNMPFGWTSSFSNFIGDSPIHLTAYSLKRPEKGFDSSGALHKESRKNCFVRLVVRGGANGAVLDPFATPLEVTPMSDDEELGWGNMPEPRYQEQEISTLGALAATLRRTAAQAAEALPQCCFEAMVASACLPLPARRRLPAPRPPQQPPPPPAWLGRE